MSTGNYDLLTGINQDKLNLIIAKVFGTASLQKTVFAGSSSGTEKGVRYSVVWSVKSAPTLSLSPPAHNDWARTIGANGKPVAERPGAMMVNISQLALKISAGDSHLDDTIPVQAIASVSGTAGRLTITPLGIIVDLSRAKLADTLAIKFGLVPELMKMLSKSLAGIEIPQLSFSGVQLTAPVVEARDGHILAAFNLTKDGAPSVGNGPTPNTPFFAIVSRELAQFVSDHEVQKNIQGEDFEQTGREAGGGFSAEYAAYGRINSIRVAVGSNPLVMRASASLSMSASAGVTTPVGMVFDAMGNVAQDVGKAIINPDTWNPTKW